MRDFLYKQAKKHEATGWAHYIAMTAVCKNKDEIPFTHLSVENLMKALVHYTKAIHYYYDVIDMDEENKKDTRALKLQLSSVFLFRSKVYTILKNEDAERDDIVTANELEEPTGTEYIVQTPIQQVKKQVNARKKTHATFNTSSTDSTVTLGKDGV